VCIENVVRFDLVIESLNVGGDGRLILLLLSLGASFFKSKSRLEAENAALRQQLIVLRRKVRGRVQLTNSDRLFFVLCCIAGFHQSSAPSRPSDPRPWCAGIVPAFAATGVGYSFVEPVPGAARNGVPKGARRKIVR
jgi:hypothetical protein